MTPIERAERAKQLLSDPVLKAAFADVRERAVAQLEQSAMDDVTTHHEAALALQALKSIQTQLARYADVIAVDKHKRKHDDWVDRMRQSIAQWR